MTSHRWYHVIIADTINHDFSIIVIQTLMVMAVVMLMSGMIGMMEGTKMHWAPLLPKAGILPLTRPCVIKLFDLSEG